jgi:hypothetical protein
MNDMINGIDWALDAESSKLDELIVEINDFIQNSEGNPANILHFDFAYGQQKLVRMSSLLKRKLNLDALGKLKLLPEVKSLFFNGQYVAVQYYSKDRTCCLFGSPWTSCWEGKASVSSARSDQVSVCGGNLVTNTALAKGKSVIPARHQSAARLCVTNVMCKRDISSVTSHRRMINLSKGYITCALALPMRALGLGAKQIIVIR